MPERFTRSLSHVSETTGRSRCGRRRRGFFGGRRRGFGKGCDTCNNTGYKGRKGIYELMKITDPLRELINERAPTVVLKQRAFELGMVTLRQDGLRSIFAGDTTIEEVLKFT